MAKMIHLTFIQKIKLFCKINMIDWVDEDMTIGDLLD